MNLQKFVWMDFVVVVENTNNISLIPDEYYSEH